MRRILPSAVISLSVCGVIDEQAAAVEVTGAGGALHLFDVHTVVELDAERVRSGHINEHRGVHGLDGVGPGRGLVFLVGAAGQGEDEEGAVLPDPGKVGADAQEAAENKHEAHHQGGACLAVVPGRADGADGLACLQRPQHRQQKMAKNTGDNGAGNGSDNQTNH